MPDKMKTEEIQHHAIMSKGVDAYYEELRLLKEDLQFFRMYISRNRKSAFGFQIIPCQMCGYAFHDIYRYYCGFSDSFIEDAYAIYTLLKAIIINIYNVDCGEEPQLFEDDVIRRFYEFMKDDLELDMLYYVSSFIGCGHGSAGTRKRRAEIISDNHTSGYAEDLRSKYADHESDSDD